MYHNAIKLSIYIIIIGLLILFERTFSWRVLSSAAHFFLSATLVFLISIIIYIFMLIKSVRFLIKNWKSIKIVSLLPLFCSCIAIVFSTVLVPPLINYQENIIITKNFDKYNHIVELVKGGSFPRESGWYKLPEGYKHLTMDGDFQIIYYDKDFEVWFPIISYVMAGHLLVYTSSDTIEDSEFHITKRLKKYWYFVIETN